MKKLLEFLTFMLILLFLAGFIACGGRQGKVAEDGTARLSTEEVAKLNKDLIMAARRGDAAAVEALLQTGADVDTVDTMGSTTALMLAARSASAKTVQLLLDADADVNAKDAYDQTALMLAADSGGIETVQLLLNAGADVNAKANTGMTAFMMVKGGGSS